MDGQPYYIRGIAAIKQGDMLKGRKLLLQSLKLDKNNDKAWLWIAKTLAEPHQQLQCAERALAINPQNTEALKLKQSINRQATAQDNVAARQTIKRLMREAETLVKTNRRPLAVDKWVAVLDLQPDHEEAMRYAVAYFMARDMLAEVKSLLYHAVDHGTKNATLLLSARDFADKQQDIRRLDALNEIIASTQWASKKQILKIADSYVEQERLDTAIHILQTGLTNHHNDPLLLNRLAEIHEIAGRENLALQYYEQVANLDVRSKLGKDADKRLSQAVPILTDRERGSIMLAGREALGVLLLFFLLAFQDSGLDLGAMGATRWMGVLLSAMGSYLLLPATSSPQQAPIAKILGGHLPKERPQRQLNPLASLLAGLGLEFDEESFYVGPIHEPSQLPIIPAWIRLVFALAGGLMLILAFYLVLPTALGLLGLPELYLDPEFYSVIFG